jgi:putative iron-dependent peroxidase
MQATEPQAILTPITEAAIFLTLTVDPGAEPSVRDALSDVSGLKRSVGFRIPEGDLTCVAGVGAAVWDRLFGLPRPDGLHPFRELNGPRHSAPATPGDLFFHIRAHRLDLCFELAQLLTERLNGYARVVDEVHGFRSFDERDLLGFVDGTENPEGIAARAAVLIGEEDPDFAGGSYFVAQKYLHDLATWNALTVEEQERAMGRTKLNDVEFPDELKPANSHIALNTIVDEHGEQHQIMRFNMPFGPWGRASSAPTSSATSAARR